MKNNKLNKLLEYYFGTAIACLIINLSYLKRYENKIREMGYEFNEDGLLKKIGNYASLFVTSLIPIINLVVAFFETKLIAEDDFSVVIEELREDNLIKPIDKINNQYNKRHYTTIFRTNKLKLTKSKDE